MQRVFSRLHTRGLSFALRYNIFAIALSAFWTPIEVLILQERISGLTSLDFRATGLGLVTFVGIGIAALTQPVAGRISDLGPWVDRRRPFIVGGAAVTLVFLGVFWWAPTYLWLFGAYILMQLSSNFAQAGFQALIPDLAHGHSRGLASGVKNSYDVLGSAIGVFGVAVILFVGYGITGSVAFIGIVLAIFAALSLLWVPTIGPLPEGQRPRSLRGLIGLRPLAASYTFSLTANHGFALAIAIRFLFLVGLYPLERFFLYFIEDRFNLTSATAIKSAGVVTGIFAVGILVFAALGAFGAGNLSDHFGRRVTLQFGIVATVVGVIGMSFSPTLLILAATGAVAAVGIGAFQASNWALIADHIPGGMGARFYGIANMATAGASALAGLFGIPVSAMRTAGFAYTFEIVFGVGALFALTSLIPLHYLTAAQASPRDSGSQGGSDRS